MSTMPAVSSSIDLSPGYNLINIVYCYMYVNILRA